MTFKTGCHFFQPYSFMNNLLYSYSLWIRFSYGKDFELSGFVILKGRDESYGVVVVQLSNRETQLRVKLLKSAIRYWDYEIEEVSLNGLGLDKADEYCPLEVRITYDFRQHGLDSEKENAVFMEAWAVFMEAWSTETTYEMGFHSL